VDSQTVQASSAAVSACATVVILIATGLYVRYTKRLWEETRRAAEQGAEQARLAAQQVDLAGREVRLRIRPYVSPKLEVKVPTLNSLEFRFHLANRGPVPAQVSNTIVEAWLDGNALPQAGINRKTVLFTGETQQTPWSSVGEEHRVFVHRRALRIRIRVEYSGPWGESYVVVWKHEDSMFLNEFALAT
jgi:hypothetical protein